MAIQVWDYRAEYEAEREDLLAAVESGGALGTPDPGRERPELRT